MQFLIQTKVAVDLTITAKTEEAALSKVEGWVDSLNLKRDLDRLNSAGVRCDDVSVEDSETKCVGTLDES